jgi:hypothetical protein
MPLPPAKGCVCVCVCVCVWGGVDGRDCFPFPVWLWLSKVGERMCWYRTTAFFGVSPLTRAPRLSSSLGAGATRRRACLGQKSLPASRLSDRSM